MKSFDKEDLGNYRGWVLEGTVAHLVDRDLPITIWKMSRYLSNGNTKKGLKHWLQSLTRA